VNTENPHETEEALMKVLPEKYWIDINHILVRFGQVICRPINPKCMECPVSGMCKWYKENVEPLN
jgi:endonuclease-3